VGRRLFLLFLLTTVLVLATTALAGENRGTKRHSARSDRSVTAAFSSRSSLPAPIDSAIGRCPLPNRFRPAFERASEQTGVSLSVLVAVAQVESDFDPGAISKAGARGLLQVLPSTAHELRIDLDDPEAAVFAGARYLKRMLDRFGSFELALAAYNAGPTAVARAGGAPSDETRVYVSDVLERSQEIAGCS
jgi:soluble lytic murein transglycosylase-like protein